MCWGWANGRGSEGPLPNPDPWQLALPGGTYAFPKDHAIHPDYKTEWWYFTGNLKADDRASFGYELTFFRQGMIPPNRLDTLTASGSTGRFVQGDFKFAHFAISDINKGKFFYTEQINRGAFGEAGFGSGVRSFSAGTVEPLAWIADWALVPTPTGGWKITAKAGGHSPMAIDLIVNPSKAPVVHGEDGVSQKSAGTGNASHYYSFTRMATAGSLKLGADGQTKQVRGESWFDHEWASNQLGADQVGWDWYCCQFSDGTELMLYAMRKRDGSVDPVSSGTWVDVNGSTTHLTKLDFELRSRRTWKSDRTGAVYPLDWHVSIPSLQLDFELKARFDAQELALPLVSYWEGAVSLDGTRAGRAVKGVGYMELTGYAGELSGLKDTSRDGVGGPGRAIR